MSLYNIDSGGYWFCLTNILPDTLEGEASGQDYTCRWQVEPVFKELKTHYRLDEPPTLKGPVAAALIFASIVTLLVSWQLLGDLRKHFRRSPYRIPEARRASLFAAMTASILDIVLLPARTGNAYVRRHEPKLLYDATESTSPSAPSASLRRSRRISVYLGMP